MRNYYDVLDLARTASNKALNDAVGALSPEQIEDEGDLKAIMETTEWRTHYQRTHLQYEAIAAAKNHPALRGTLDTHQWSKRVIEFEPEQNTIDFGAPDKK